MPFPSSHDQLTFDPLTKEGEGMAQRTTQENTMEEYTTKGEYRQKCFHFFIFLYIKTRLTAIPPINMKAGMESVTAFIPGYCLAILLLLKQTCIRLKKRTTLSMNLISTATTNLEAQGML